LTERNCTRSPDRKPRRTATSGRMQSELYERLYVTRYHGKLSA